MIVLQPGPLVRRIRALCQAALVLAVLSYGGAVRVALAQTVSLPPFLELRVPKPPTVASADGQAFLAHELHVTNFAADTVTLARVEVLRAGTAGGSLLTVADTALMPIVARPGVSARDSTRLRLAGGTRAVIYLWVPVMGDAPPDSITHRLTIRQHGDDSTSTGQLEGATVPVARQAAPVGPPLRGGVWLTGNGPGNASGHRRALIPIGGTPSIAQRFAIDYVKVDEQGRRHTGDSLRNESYYAQGEDALAVAAGTVVAIKDGIPENVPGVTSRVVPITLETVGGNYVILDIGGGRYAFYAHLQPRSLRVQVGDRVERGAVLGLVGNSGNSTEPHLHFHIADGTTPLGSEGVPYRQDFEVVGSCQGFSANCPRQAAEHRRAEQPLGGILIRFPE
jgi:murein DD-endopeptidase